jgi:hypothetical protein
MPTATLRLPPSGPEVVNDGGGPLSFGPGARLRMTEFGSVIGDGSEPLPTLAAAVTLTGFTGSPLVLSFTNPKPDLYYRAETHCALICSSTNPDAQAEMFLDTSIDGGVTWTNRASTTTRVLNNIPGGQTFAQLDAAKMLGSDLGVGLTTAELLLRVRMASTLNPVVELFGPSTPSPGNANSKGTFYFKLEELF